MTEQVQSRGKEVTPFRKPAKAVFLLPLIFLLWTSCTSRPVKYEPLMETFYEFTSGSRNATISFGTNSSFDTVITDVRKVNMLRDAIRQSVKSDTCYYLTGKITFLEGKHIKGSVDFGLNSKCPSFYIYIEGKPVTYKMTFRAGRFLEDIYAQVSKKTL